MAGRGGSAWGAIGLGLLPIGSLFVDVGIWITFLLGVLASAGAGWLMPGNPVRAGVLAYAPTAVIVAVGGILVLSAGVFLPLLMGLMVSLVGSHFGAGSALRRRGASDRDPAG